MKFLNLLIKQLLFFFILLPSSIFSQEKNHHFQSAPEPLVSIIATLPSGYATSFRGFTVAGEGKLLIAGDNQLLIHDGVNWERIVLTERPNPISDAQGKIFFSSKNCIEQLIQTDKGSFERNILVDLSSIPSNQKVTNLIVGPKQELYFSTINMVWKFSDRLHRIDSSSNRIFLHGNQNGIYYVKENEGIFAVNGNETLMLQGPKPEIISAINPVQVFQIKNRSVAIVKDYPWLIKLNDGSTIINHNLADYMQPKESRIKKAYFKKNEIFLLTENDGIIILDNDFKVKSHIKNDSQSFIEQAIEILPYSEGTLLLLTKSSIARVLRTEIAGYYSKENLLSSSPTSLYFDNSTIFCATNTSLLVADYPASPINDLSFNKISGINGQITTFYNHKGKLYAAGKAGVFVINGGKAQRVTFLNMLQYSDYINLTEIDGELWLVHDYESQIVGICASNSKLSTLKIPYPTDFHSIDNLKTRGKFIFCLSSNGKWYKTKLIRSDYGWTEVFSDDAHRMNFYLPFGFNQKTYATKNGTLHYLDCETGDVSAPIASDSASYLSPLLEIESTLVLKRFFKAFPDVYSVWLYRPTDNDSLYQPFQFAASINTAEIINQAIILPDSTLLLSSTSGFYYFSNSKMLRNAFRSIVSIFRVSLESGKNKITLKDGYIIAGEKPKITNRTSLNRNIQITMASIGCSEWGLSHGNVQFASFLMGYDSDWTSWTNNHTREINKLFPGEYTLHVKARNFLGEESTVESFTFIILPSIFQTQLFYIFFTLLGILGIFMIYQWRRYLHTKERFKLESLINLRTEELVKEKEKTENLLARVLPKDTADELKEKGKVNTQRFQVVTVLFCDIEGFTRITDETNPEVLIDQLDKFFLYFDSVVEKFRIEKIKTIGDAYMCAGGIPKKNRTNPVEVVLAALEMMQYMKHITSSDPNKSRIWDLRIGIDTGPVIAGVVGRNKLSYDIWGSTVNTASRMESSGEVGQINISGNTFMLVKEYFICTFRGKMPVKNKGDIQMYFVNGIKPSLSETMKGIVPNQDFYIQLQLIRLGDLEDFVLEKLEKGLPKNLYYHNLKHTVDVYTQVELIGRSEDVTKEELLLLRTAALFHDAGHLVDYDTHEEMAVKLVREILPQYQYTESQIDLIAELIMVTKLPPKPQNLLEEIMCDADLDYLGRPDFIPVSHMLYKELHEHGKIGTEREWNELQIKFIDSHFYFTKTARRLRNVNKQSQLEKLKAWMEKN